MGWPRLDLPVQQDRHQRHGQWMPLRCYNGHLAVAPATHMLGWKAIAVLWLRPTAVA